MGRRTLFFEDEALDDLVYLARHADKLPVIAAKSFEVQAGATFLQIEKYVSSAIGGPEIDVERILRIILNIYRSQRGMRVDPKRFVEEVAWNLEERAQDQGSKANLETWQKAQETILKTLKTMGPDHPLHIARKAERLAVAHRNTISEMRILTDLRPVFNQPGDQILQAVVTQALLIEYFDGMINHRIEFGLEAAELTELRQICQRAEGKAVTLKDALKTLSWPTRVSLNEGEGNE